MNILIIGSGGREYTFAWKIAQSFHCDQLYIAPGNAGTELIGENVDLAVDDFEGIGQFVIDNDVELVVVGPEDPLVKGIRDYFEADETLIKIALVGPDKIGAQLEGSKDFSKVFMEKHGVPTAKSRTFTADSIEDGLVYLQECNLPIVLKADGLAAGKGVVIAKTLEEAQRTLKAMLLDKQFGEASNKVLIEEFLDGIELSVFVLTDGENYVILPEAKDYKRIGDNDTGPNTGGMGAVSPVKFATKVFMERVESEVVKPTITGLQNDKIDYKGFIFIGLMNVDGAPFVIEYNVRMGDPETQVVLPRIKNDLVELLVKAADGKLKDYQLEVSPNFATTVVLVSGGYPGSYEKNKSIQGLADVTNALVVHAGTRQEDYEVLTNGGRVLAITGMGDSLEKALEVSYHGVKNIRWDDMYYRKDIGKDILRLQLD
ncbi:phosphoribosylamine--glycine ligase [Fulvivirga sp. M361]|uniref:phosphoribosylamine--glycine ligase n=1 Tax=Fulvivirga sp. M361 TaxID=2594266 RepID=UPI00117B64D6|nr:phosphoribosylamine--glycine ligase [Fulvivirga sp. M361]TRX53704.1 phosphoribosylamine--glycine ligase [Fulvivirga sp. M361]